MPILNLMWLLKKGCYKLRLMPGIIFCTNELQLIILYKLGLFQDAQAHILSFAPIIDITTMAWLHFPGLMINAQPIGVFALFRKLNRIKIIGTSWAFPAFLSLLIMEILLYQKI